MRVIRLEEGMGIFSMHKCAESKRDRIVIDSLAELISRACYVGIQVPSPYSPLCFANAHPDVCFVEDHSLLSILHGVPSWASIYSTSMSEV